MTNLEFIEKEIKNCEEFLKKAIRYNLTICIKNEKEKLNHLQQIKFELEAWEIAKSKEIDILSVKTALDLESFNIDLVKAYQLTEEEFNKLKKELGVEE